MHWSKKNKGIVIFLIVIVAVVLLCLGDYGLRYYDTPKEETYDYVGSGMLVGLVNPQFYQQVPVEIHAKRHILSGKIRRIIFREMYGWMEKRFLVMRKWDLRHFS